ncbi:hypothetical protein ACFO3J_02015 [Streptomyces polygonati]|uniref:Uncharacterized protein n=1 Tax=Streptomyces polygonati TaxID=1617087 RepID=A0ABV8HIY6_9ACTN
MPTLAVTGHIDLTDASVPLIRAALRDLLAAYAGPDRLIAIWNGQPPTGKGGGTADAVLEARAAGIPVDMVWPRDAGRERSDF